MALTDTAVRTAKPQDKPYRLFDGGGLYLEVSPRGGKWWRLKYRYAGAEKRLSLGTYPDTSLKEARDKRYSARKALEQGMDPSQARKSFKSAALAKAESTFEAIAREWYAKYSPGWAPGHGEKIIRRLERDVFPWLGSRPIAEIAPPELLEVLRRVEERGALETAHRAMQNCSRVFRYAAATGRAKHDPTSALRGALPPAKGKHHPSFTDPMKIGALMRAISGYQGSHVTRCALRLAPLVFVRPGELRAAKWVEIDLESAEWRIPAARMKMRAVHIVPLSRQAVALLREFRPLDALPDAYVFPSERSIKRPMSENTVNAALRRLGYSKEELTGHGFRSMASTILNEQGWNRDAIERQLAHAERDEIRAAYNYAEHLPERRKMMQSWADHLEALAAGAQVVPLRVAAK